MAQSSNGSSSSRRVSEDRSSLSLPTGSKPARRHSVSYEPSSIAFDANSHGHGRRGVNVGTGSPGSASGTSSPSLTKLGQKARRYSVAGPPHTGGNGRLLFPLTESSSASRQTGSPMMTRSRRSSLTPKPTKESATVCPTSTDVIDEYINAVEFKASPGPPLPSGSFQFTVTLHEMSQDLEQKRQDTEHDDKENNSTVAPSARRNSLVRFALPTGKQ